MNKTDLIPSGLKQYIDNHLDLPGAYPILYLIGRRDGGLEAADYKLTINKG